MVEETIQEVRQTEMQAGNILMEAKNNQKEIFEDARAKAQHWKEEYLAKIKEGVEHDLNEARMESQQKQKQEQEKMQAEVQFLKEMALQKKEEAISLVMQEMI